MYKTIDDWNDDLLTDEGTVAIAHDSSQPVWKCCDQNGAPTLMDPLLYEVGSTATLGPLTFNISPQIPPEDLKELGATLTVGSETAPLQLDDVDSGGNYRWGGGPLCPVRFDGWVENFDQELSFSITWSGGGQSTIAGVMQTFFLTLGPPLAFQVGSSTYRVTAKRVDYVTEAFVGSEASDDAVREAKEELAGCPDEDGHSVCGLFHFGNGTLGSQSPWAALYRPAAFPYLDCISLSVIAVAELEQAGAEAYASYAYATTDLNGFAATALDATFGKTINDSISKKPYQWLDWYLSGGGSPQQFEAYVFLCSGGAATEADTIFPPDGPFVGLPFDATNPADGCPGPTLGQSDPPPPPRRLALSVIFNTLKTEQDNATSPRDGRQWWVDARMAPVGSAAVPFPIMNKGVQ